jgi:IS605 OrfB family transposase
MARRPTPFKGWEESPSPNFVFKPEPDKYSLRTMLRAILLQTEPTKAKERILTDFSVKATSLANSLLKQRKSKKLMELHRATYSASKLSTSFNSQVICDIERSVVKAKGHNLNAITVKFNVPRNARAFSLSSDFVELGIRPKQRIAVPIKKNRNWQRYKDLLTGGWGCKTYGLTTTGQIVAFLSSPEREIPARRNIIGVDVNSKCYAATVLTPDGKVLKQLYFGKDIWIKRKRIMARRDKLRSLADKGSHKAVQSLRKLRTKEQNFVKNRIGEVVRDITNLALKYDADIAIEDLKRFSPKGRRFNKEVLRMPILLFKTTMEARCFDKNITLTTIDPYHTSKWCTHCGAVSKGHSAGNYALFKCSCGQVVNSDRKASLAIAVKSLVVRNLHGSKQTCFFQFTTSRVPVIALLRSDAVDVCNAVHSDCQLMESPLPSGGG